MPQTPVTVLTTYTIGDDVIAQKVGTATQYLLYDGHGSTRQLAGYISGTDSVSIADSYSYDGYGVLLQDENTFLSAPTGLGYTPGYTPPQATSLLYSGEMFDSDAQQYYLRARYYNPLNGLFNRMDPYGGNMSDPQTLHKYLYCHANPVNGIDPSGMFNYSEITSVQGIMIRFMSFAQKVLTIVDKIQTGIDLIHTIMDVLRLFSSSGQELLSRGLDLLKKGFKDMQKILSIDFLKEALNNLLMNQGKIMSTLLTNATNPRLKNIAKAMLGDDPRILIMMPTPPLRFLNPLFLLDTGLKFKIRKIKLNIRVSLYFGHGSWTGRFLGLGVIENKSTSSSMRNPYQIFRMDWHKPNPGDHAGSSAGYWPSDDFHYHVLQARN